MNYFKRKRLTKKYISQSEISWLYQEILKRYADTIKKLFKGINEQSIIRRFKRSS